MDTTTTPFVAWVLDEACIRRELDAMVRDGLVLRRWDPTQRQYLYYPTTELERMVAVADETASHPPGGVAAEARMTSTEVTTQRQLTPDGLGAFLWFQG